MPPSPSRLTSILPRPAATAPALLAALLITLLCTSTAFAAEPTPASGAAEPAAPMWTLQVDPLTTALGFVHLQVERALAPHWSIYLGPHARLFNSLLDDLDEPFTGLGVEMGVRYFFYGAAPSGLWAQIRGVIARLSTARGGGQSGLGGYASALVGYNAIFAGRWVLGGGLGVQYLHYTIAGMGPKRFFVAAHTTVGVAF